MIREAQQRLREVERTFDFLVCDAQWLPVQEESFDAVIANHMLYHVPNREKAYSEILRVLKPGGRLYAATGGVGHLRELSDLVSRVKPDFAMQVAELEAIGFNLENGGDELVAWFAGVEVRRSDGELMITEVDPLIRYVQSADMMRLNDHQVSRFREQAQQLISVDGAIRITTSQGLFAARKA